MRINHRLQRFQLRRPLLLMLLVQRSVQILDPVRQLAIAVKQFAELVRVVRRQGLGFAGREFAHCAHQLIHRLHEPAG
ncbi:hypothetical protein D3C86_2138920 [compost metagenome]